jgi:magnesium-transporting ATPase (P-type)
MAFSSLWLFNMFHERTGSYVYANTITFMALVACQWANALNANFEFRSWVTNLVRPNFKLGIGLSLAIFFQWLVMFGPLRAVFGIDVLEWSDLLFSMLPAVFVLIAVDLHKAVAWLVKSWRHAS